MADLDEIDELMLERDRYYVDFADIKRDPEQGIPDPEEPPTPPLNRH